LLWRDRNLFVQTLVVPLVIVGFQIAVNAELLEAIRSSFNHAAVMAFGLGAYALLFSTVNALVVEGQAIWLLFTVPEPIERTVLRKALLWGTFASLGPTALLAWALSRAGALSAQNLLTAALVIAGVYIYAIIGAVIGSLATDLFEKEARRRIRPAMLYLFMFLAGLYGYAIYAPVAWHRVAMLVLSAALAYAVWQKLRDQAAYLLDPTQSAPRRLSLSDGLVVALVFFVLQGIFAVIFKNGTDLPPGQALVIAYAVAGALVVGGSLVVFEIRGTRVDLFTREDPRRLTLLSVLEGFGVGLFALGIGLTYTIAADLVEPLRRLKEVMPHLTQVAVGSRWWFLLLVVVFAPPIEEFIFRGLIYRGLRRTARPAVAALVSALIFAICHPPIAFVPVFLLGVLTAICLERHGRLIVPILIHAVYNGGALLLGG
jgi:membrane protease YdiL (CAAX protease family)